MLSPQRAVSAKSTITLIEITVSDQIGYWLLPRKPSWPMMLMDTTMIENQRAQPCPRYESEACEDKQHAPDQHDPAPCRQVDDEEARPGDDEVLVFEQSD